MWLSIAKNANFWLTGDLVFIDMHPAGIAKSGANELPG